MPIGCRFIFQPRPQRYGHRQYQPLALGLAKQLAIRPKTIHFPANNHKALIRAGVQHAARCLHKPHPVQNAGRLAEMRLLSKQSVSAVLCDHALLRLTLKALALPFPLLRRLRPSLPARHGRKIKMRAKHHKRTHTQN